VSVTVLYCEGNPKSIDIRVIRQLVPKCDIRPLGGKTSSFFNSIIADRRRNPNLAENVWEWLPEWKTLRQLIEETKF